MKRRKAHKHSIFSCDNNYPYTTFSTSRMIYVYPEKNLSAYPDVKYDLKEWVTYKIRVIFENQIPVLFKDYFYVDNHNTTY